VELPEIDPIYYQSSYYLVPDRGAAKAYSLLFHALKDSNKIGVAKVVLRTKQYLCAVRPFGKVLALSRSSTTTSAAAKGGDGNPLAFDAARS
jgi:DNA end-binding protein Ku